MSLEIESALRALLARSSDCVWRRDRAGYSQCWASDGEWHILGEVVRGREAIVSRWVELMAPFEKVWQLSHNVVFGFDRDQPAARVYLEETLVPAGAPVNFLKGIYHDSYRLEDGAWRFARRHIDIGYLGPADFSGRWFPMIDHGPAPHDPDPSRLSTPSMAEAYG
ncbi:nuclear transport factor 2 family protein [Sphingobium aromaticiconvertens]|uniref:nuclear transport factor 2 family protein n=1 Tax=Sphingobium aromaticiconvertens TaxID=365341 RepID=UPI003015B7C6